MSEKWRENLIKIEPYTAGKQSDAKDLIKLNANENPYPPSPKVKKAIQDFDTDSLRLYPDISNEPLRSKLADYYGLRKEEVFVGNGSDDVLAAAFRAFFNSDKPIVYPDITYSFYPVWCSLLSVPYKTIALKDDFTVDVEDYAEPNGGVVLPNPNAPTSLVLGLDKIERLLEINSDAIVLLDETYIDFGGETALPLLKKYKNLVITRTFSKSRSLAGMRIGFAMANEELISCMNAVKDSYNSYPLDRVAMAAGAASVEDEKYFRETLDRIISEREKFIAFLDGLGFETLESSANFVFTKAPDNKSVELFDYLEAKNIFIRHFSAERINDYLRITIGTEEEMKKLTDEIRKFFA